MQLTEKEVAIATRAYFATISFTDSEIGRVLDAARALGEKVWDEMVVVLWSDHGASQRSLTVYLSSACLSLDALQVRKCTILLTRMPTFKCMPPLQAKTWASTALGVRCRRGSTPCASR